MTRQIETAAYLLIFLNFLRRLSRKVLLKYTVPGFTYKPGETHWLSIRIYTMEGTEEYWPCAYIFSASPGFSKPPTKAPSRSYMERALTKLRNTPPAQVFPGRGSDFRKVEYSIIPKPPDNPETLVSYIKFKLTYGIVTASRIRLLINDIN